MEPTTAEVLQQYATAFAEDHQRAAADFYKVQPGQAYSSAAAGTFGTITSTVGRTVGLGTSRQVQFALRLNF